MSLPLNQVVLGDCVEVMAGWPDNSVDCIVTDPPYGISFMGKEWDLALPPMTAFKQMIRVLKPGALAFVMSSPRQDVLWRMLSMLEGVGFNLRTSFITWVYRTGFPKALDVSKGIDNKLGLERKIIGNKPRKVGSLGGKGNGSEIAGVGQFRDDSWKGSVEQANLITEPASDLAKKWEGWKSQTGLKPAAECVLMVNKPRSEPTIVDNVLRWGTGAINVDACRIPFQGEGYSYKAPGGSLFDGEIYGKGDDKGFLDKPYESNQKGRFPANLLISDGALDTGETTKTGNITPEQNFKKTAEGYVPANVYGKYRRIPYTHEGDEGSPFRFFDLDAWSQHHGFLDVAKPSRAERGFGLGTFPLKHAPIGNYEGRDLENPKNIMRPGMQDRKARNIHPTCKPVKLMAYLIELGCPPKGIVVDPFVGSGTTCIAAKRLRRRWIGIEINPEYAAIAEARINIRGPLDQFLDRRLNNEKIEAMSDLELEEFLTDPDLDDVFRGLARVGGIERARRKNEGIWTLDY